MIKIDMWNNNSIKEVDRITIFFNNCGGYWGNVFVNDEIAGDYTASDSLEIEKNFPQLTINWR